MFYSSIQRSTGEIWLLDQYGDLILAMKKGSKTSNIFTRYQCEKFKKQN